MTKYFTHYWRNDTWENNRTSKFADYALKHISGNDLKQRGIEVGDNVFVVTVKQGKLFLAGKLVVGKYCKLEEIAKEMNCKPSDLWDAKYHIVASEFTTTTEKHWDLPVPPNITEKLEFIRDKEIKTLKFKSKNYLDPQTLRKVRQLTFDSAKKLNELLSDFDKDEIAVENVESNWQNEPESESYNLSFQSSVEGNKSQKFTTKYERDPKLRKRAVEIHGYICQVCDFNFEEHYGEHGKNFIHVHHIQPLFQFEAPQEVNPKTDMSVLCPNCHSMIHRNKNKTLSLADLRAIYKK